MAEKYAVRNLRLCTKDCLCLYVCPTGATNTENSIIDPEKCIGCGACAEACPSSAISMVPKELPPQQPKEEKVVEALRGLVQSKANAENIASQLSDVLSVAVEKSSRLMAEDLCREAGFMLPQSGNTRSFLESIKTYPGIPVDAVESLLKNIQFNEKMEEMKMSTKFYICEHCGNLVGMIHDSGVPMMCCGQKMTALIPNTVEASGEKHKPVVKVEGNTVTVNVGSVDHPMLSEHFIEWVYVQTENGGQRKALKPDGKPNVTFCLGDDKAVAVYAYCNLHGLWMTEV